MANPGNFIFVLELKTVIKFYGANALLLTRSVGYVLLLFDLTRIRASELFSLLAV